MQVQPALQPALLDLRNSFRPKIPKSLLICIWNFTWKFSSLQHFVGCWRLYVGFLPSQMNVVQKWKYFTNVTKPLTSASHEKLQWRWLQSQEKIVCFTWNEIFFEYEIFYELQKQTVSDTKSIKVLVPTFEKNNKNQTEILKLPKLWHRSNIRKALMRWQIHSEKNLQQNLLNWFPNI